MMSEKWMTRVFRFGNGSARVWLMAALLLMGSPHPLSAMACLSSRIIRTIEPAGVDQPSDVALGPQGFVYLVDGVNNRIVVTGGDGSPQFTFGRMGAKPGEFLHPMGIDISKTGQVFIADTGNHRIQVFDMQGEFLSQFQVKKSAGENPPAPVDVLAMARKNYIYISDKDNHKIKVHDQDGEFVFEWGGFGTVQGRFRYPGILAANQYNQVLVVDVLNTRVQVFDPDGGFITDISGWGVTPGRVFRPKGVAVDHSGRVYISDSFLECIQVFSDLGGFLGVVCDGSQKRGLTTPVGLAFDAKNQLYAVEMRANRVSVLNISR